MTPHVRPPASVELYWLPLGAGASCVRWNGRAYEAAVAFREHRDRCDLYHAALQVQSDGDRFIIEMAPVWDRHEPDRGVVAEGAVGLPWLGRSRWFRYEVRRWRNGTIPDVSHAVDSPRRLSTNRAQAQQVLQLAPAFPTVTWGRDELRTGDMWNSNSLVAWLLTRSGHDTDVARPPPHGRAPGWSPFVATGSRFRGLNLLVQVATGSHSWPLVSIWCVTRVSRLSMATCHREHPSSADLRPSTALSGSSR